MSEEQIDKTIASVDAKNEQISDLEAKLKAFEEAEAQRAADAKAAEEKSIQDRLDAMEAEKVAMKESFDKKLDDIQMRVSTANTSKESTGLSREDYEKNKVKYDTMYLKATLPDVFNK